ncbi:FAD/NAD(P)-binding protein [Bacillus cereus]|uniref:FAD/NAD(P)-binding protein n=1 Tax=Bacillus cereus TaxID=1396 RepID=UPI000C28733A|nr:FAD/NAD(P)-binding protein [Bacillus cereus]
MRQLNSSIAIIGSGAAGVSLLHYLTVNLNKSNVLKPQVSITIYEKESSVGPGIAYQDDCQSLLLNRESKQMSVMVEKPNHFWEWYQSKCRMVFEQEEFLPRSLFGEYLKYVFEKSIQRALKKNIKINIKYNEVTNILKRDKKYVVMTSDKETEEFDQVLICIGSTRLNDFYNLNEKSQYIYNPYPFKEKMSFIPNNSKVAILGSSLTAIDICLALKENGHRGKIDMLSRRGELPSVRGEIKPYQLKYLNRDSLMQILLIRNGEITLRDIVRLIKEEFSVLNLDWKYIFSPNYKDTNIKKKLEAEIRNSQMQGAWQSILLAMNGIIEEYWYFLSEKDKKLYIERYDSIFQSRRNPMPVNNAIKILNFLNDGKLSIKKGITNVNYQEERTFCVQFNNGEYVLYDWIINATGPTKNLNKLCGSKLVDSLIRNGSAVTDTYGGLKIEFGSGTLIRENGELNKGLRALGHITCGTYYYTSSMEMIAKHAKTIAEDISRVVNKSLKEDQKVVNSN